jgi:polar amino acid transport system substrate-binding protein
MNPMSEVKMNTWKITALSAAVSIVVSLSAIMLAPQNRTASTPAQSDSYARVVSSKTIRCGYVIAPPYTIRDPNSGKLSGLSYETMELAAKQAGYKLVWAEEVGWATMIEGLQTGRYDIICSGVWVNSARAQFSDFSAPIFYNAINAYVRVGDNRFDTNLPPLTRYAAINRPDVTIATVDGEISAGIADESFPQAKRLAIPQSVDVSQLLLNVVDRKADITFVEPYTAVQFLKSHPGTLRDISSDRPIRIYPYSYMVPKGAYALKGLMDAMLLQIVISGQEDSLITKYDIEPGTIYPLVYPYRQPLQVTGR